MDFPKPGILFYDITTLLKDKTGFAQLIDAFAAHFIGKEIDLVLGIEARGFIFGPALAYRLNAGFVPVRKPKKLPAKVAITSATFFSSILAWNVSYMVRKFGWLTCCTRARGSGCCACSC